MQIDVIVYVLMYRHYRHRLFRRFIYLSVTVKYDNLFKKKLVNIEDKWRYISEIYQFCILSHSLEFIKLTS